MRLARALMIEPFPDNEVDGEITWRESASGRARNDLA
jgi:hypothetical protein